MAPLAAAWREAKQDSVGKVRSADDVRLMALANLHREYAGARTNDEVLAALGA
ncbi:hypothetical protein D3C81_107900 [compost metagenome]